MINYLQNVHAICLGTETGMKTETQTVLTQVIYMYKPVNEDT